MRIIIAGAGAVGRHLAKLLSREDMDISLIDERQDRLGDLDANYDLLTKAGSPTSIHNLKNIGVKDADLFIAVMPSESDNITACLLANQLGAKKTLARIDNYEYLLPENKHIFDQIEIGKVEARWCKSVDGKDLHSWVIYPPHFDPTKKYPTLLFCEGGPQSPVSQFWSYRWNFQIMAANGYIIIAPNRRGLPGFGLEWNEEISTNYGGNCMSDLLTAIDDICKEPYVDTDRLGCVGASFGGYSAMWLAGHHEKRFKAFIAHCGIFNFESMYGHTEELFFVTNDYGGAYWDKDNATAQRSYANSPHKLVANWNAPIMIITGEKDYRIPYSQSLEAFTAARVQGIDARLVSFENEAHQVFQPQNSVVWNREFFDWLDKYLK